MRKGVGRASRLEKVALTEEEIKEKYFKDGKDLRLEKLPVQEQEYKWERVGRGMKRVPVETLDTGQVTPMTPQTGPALVAGQMEANALATSQTGSTITDASSSTIVNNSNQSMMMPLPDPNPHNMDFRVEERLFPS